ncbi:hypothetical protein BK816_08190 [Boudabousia tangfeifanii]|uniref:DUF4375 domain-containing protein n=1 Tax=Boudabousia tangfeifanii TaxID=1912795 RepID=A0A1D9MLV7_9ACTO|nr:hypothetical protein [Boudabousia tangfeifanii]AOZ73265.1 hypothetical protein BK816_08190 [Boudabousia tangfeifanii]
MKISRTLLAVSAFALLASACGACSSTPTKQTLEKLTEDEQSQLVKLLNKTSCSPVLALTAELSVPYPISGKECHGADNAPVFSYRVSQETKAIPIALQLWNALANDDYWIGGNEHSYFLLKENIFNELPAGAYKDKFKKFTQDFVPDIKDEGVVECARFVESNVRSWVSDTNYDPEMTTAEFKRLLEQNYKDLRERYPIDGKKDSFEIELWNRSEPLNQLCLLHGTIFVEGQVS